MLKLPCLINVKVRFEIDLSEAKGRKIKEGHYVERSELSECESNKPQCDLIVDSFSAVRSGCPRGQAILAVNTGSPFRQSIQAVHSGGP